jgi:hypothetical protein
MDMSLDDLYGMSPEQLGEQLTQLRHKNKTRNKPPLNHLPKLESAQINRSKEPVIKAAAFTQPLPSIRGQISPRLVQPCIIQSNEMYQCPSDPYFPEAIRNTTDSLFPNISPYNDSPFLQRIFFNQSPVTLDNFFYTPQNATPFSSYRSTYSYGGYGFIPFKGTLTLTH